MFCQNDQLYEQSSHCKTIFNSLVQHWFQLGHSQTNFPWYQEYNPMVPKKGSSKIVRVH